MQTNRVARALHIGFVALLIGLILASAVSPATSGAATPARAAEQSAAWEMKALAHDLAIETDWPIQVPGRDEWIPTPASGPPTPGRTAHSAVWTGQELVIWGGQGRTNPNDGRAHNTGAAYAPQTDMWTNIAPADVIPWGRMSHTTVWTGAEMLVWGGTDYRLVTLGTGARYDRISNRWAPIAAVNAPISRWGHSAVWTGDKMIVWGGQHMVVTANATLNDGAAYDPVADRWQMLSIPSSFPARQEHSAIWTDTEMIVWGGRDANTFFASGSRYNPSSSTWSPVSHTGAPSARSGHTAIWTGQEMIIWGGRNTNGPQLDGARYDPVADRWQALPAPNVAVAQGRAVWTGSEMIIWGMGVGAAFNPVTNTWRSLSAVQAPSARYGHSATWTGEEMIVWGGQINGEPEFKDGARYNPQTDRWAPLPATQIPEPRWSHSAVWTGSQMIVWGGETSDNLGAIVTNDGFEYDPAANVWREINSVGAPSPRAGHTAVWTGAGMIVWGGVDISSYLKSGAVYDRAQDRWFPMPEPANLAGRSGHTAIWTGTEMIIWGGWSNTSTSSTTFNDGARYNPVTQTWQPVSNVNAPSPRTHHTAIWTGREMIVWGGLLSGLLGNTDTGARYDPVTDRWTPLPTENAPRARDRHTSVWTGVEMIVWGGAGPCCYSTLNNGGRYNLTTDTWSTMATDETLPARKSHTAIWTGQEMILWGTASGGARYSPYVDQWHPLTQTHQPTGIHNHSAVWTGEEMIVWGGSEGGPIVATGGRWRINWLKTYMPVIVKSN